MSDNEKTDKKESWLELIKNIAAFELAFALFDFFARVVREFFGILLTVIFGAAIVIALIHFLRDSLR